MTKDNMVAVNVINKVRFPHSSAAIDHDEFRTGTIQGHLQFTDFRFSANHHIQKTPSTKLILRDEEYFLYAQRVKFSQNPQILRVEEHFYPVHREKLKD